MRLINDALLTFVAAVFTLVALTHPEVAAAEERQITLDRGIAATLTLPQEVGPHPAVLLLHGLGSSRDEVGNLFADMAEMLAESGIISLRIDFRGFGKSLGDMGDFAPKTALGDAAVALSALAKMPEVDATRIGALGFSFGAGIATELAASASGEIKSLVLWAPIGDYESDIRESFGQKAFDRAREDGVVGVDLGWRTLALRRGFFDDLANHDPKKALSRYQGALLILNGSDDPYLKYAEGLLSAAAGARKQARSIEGADHIFNVYTPSRSKVSELFEATSDWLHDTLLPKAAP